MATKKSKTETTQRVTGGSLELVCNGIKFVGQIIRQADLNYSPEVIIGTPDEKTVYETFSRKAVGLYGEYGYKTRGWKAHGKARLARRQDHKFMIGCLLDELVVSGNLSEDEAIYLNNF